MSYRASADGTLEVLHPETQLYVPAQTLLQSLDGHEVRLNATQQAVLHQLADALIQDRDTPDAQAYLASLQSLLSAVANNVDELEPVLKQVRDALNIGNGNTLYARLVEALAQLTAINNTLTTNIGVSIDELEPVLEQVRDALSIGNGNTLYARLVDALAQLTAINGLTTSIGTAVDGLEFLIGSSNDLTALTNTMLSALSAQLPASVGQKAMAASLAVTLASDQTVLPVKPPAPTTDYTKIQASAGEVIKASAGRLFSLACSNYNTSVRYLQLFDRITAPTGAPLKVYPVYPANTNGPGFLILDRNFFGTDGAAFATGICWGFSTAVATYTAGAASDCVFEARYT